ncbi:MAG: electron transfer flavoprotein subunit alpha/FixB family protein [Dehalococcoidia bacterium]|nr:electron transfer flavoprotein subunit alpha/FixB family protein [Dehalococcoidia bacterium]
MPVDKGIWVLAEQRGGELQEVSLELVSEGRKLADKLKEELSVVLLGHNVAPMAATFGQHGADTVYHVDSPHLTNYVAEFYTDVIANLLKEHRPRLAMCGATSIGKDLGPRLAARLKVGLVSDCVNLIVAEDGSLVLTKPTYGGKTYSNVGCINKPQLATVRTGLMEIKKARIPKKPQVVEVKPEMDPNKLRCKVVGFVKADPKTVSLTEAEIIVSGGRGIGSKENFKIIEDLAEALGASVACSRVPVDEGWASFEKQVGQTGKTVTPRLYVACGISGAIYHAMGMKDSKAIIAINSDKNAPILKLADVGVVGDLHAILPELTAQLKELKQKAKPAK